MASSQLMHEIKRHAAIAVMQAKHIDVEIARVLEHTSSFMLKVRKVMEAFSGHVSSTAMRQKAFTAFRQ